MKFLTLTRILAALLATSGLASASIDVCAGGVKLECDKGAVELLGSLDSMDPLTAFRSVRTFLESNCDGACLSSELKADLCEKAHSIKSRIQEKIYLEDIEQCFSDTSAEEESCHVSYECPPGTPEGNKCVTNSCVSKGAAAAEGPRAMSAKGRDNCHYSYQCPPGSPPDSMCLTEICDNDLFRPDLCHGNGEYLGGPFNIPDSVCKEKCCSGSCHVVNSCHPGSPEGSFCLSTVCSAIDLVLKVVGNEDTCLKGGANLGRTGISQAVCAKKCCSRSCQRSKKNRDWHCSKK